MMTRILMIMTVVGMLTACISGVQPEDSYTSRSGTTTVIQSNKEMCTQACNDDYSRCMDSDSAQDNSGVHGPSGMFGAGAECHNALKDCLPQCKGQ